MIVSTGNHTNFHSLSTVSGCHFQTQVNSRPPVTPSGAFGSFELETHVAPATRAGHVTRRPRARARARRGRRCGTRQVRFLFAWHVPKQKKLPMIYCQVGSCIFFRRSGFFLFSPPRPGRPRPPCRGPDRSGRALSWCPMSLVERLFGKPSSHSVATAAGAFGTRFRVSVRDLGSSVSTDGRVRLGFLYGL